jgi:hypothetical protein
MIFYKGEEKYWEYMADDLRETTDDANMLRYLKFKDFLSGGESVADYASNIFLYWDL